VPRSRMGQVTIHRRLAQNEVIRDGRVQVPRALYQAQPRHSGTICPANAAGPVQGAYPVEKQVRHCRARKELDTRMVRTQRRQVVAEQALNKCSPTSGPPGRPHLPVSTFD